MCTCSSCEYTESGKFMPDKDDAGNYIDGTGFPKWPAGDPAGKRSSAAAYAAHWAHCGAAFHRKPETERLGGPPRYPSWVTCQINMPIPQAPAYVLRAINPGVSIVAQDLPADNVVASHPAKPRAVRQIAPAIQGPSIAELLEQAIAIRGERPQERIAA